MARIETNCRGCGAALPEPNPSDAGRCPRCGGTTGGRRGRSAIVAGAAVAAIAAAGAVIYAYFPDDLLRARPGAAPAAADPAARREVSDAPDKAETRTRLVVARGGAGGAVVMLGQPAGPQTYQDLPGTRQGLLLRELVRQALLIAARDELGLATRDQVIDDLAPPADEAGAAELSTVFRNGASRALLRRAGGAGAGAGLLLKLDLGPNPDSGEYASDLAARLERLSREDFVAALKGLGAEGTANRARKSAPVPEGVEGRLAGLGLVGHVAAIRDLHAAIRSDGESPERLGALARAYAKLGALAEFHWHPAHKAYKARAMLYAERALARRPGSASVLRDRAFVRALVGNHAEALADLEAAGKVGGAAEAAPPWEPTIRAYLMGDLARLAADGGPLAALLRMTALEFPQKTRAAVLAARDVLKVDADCLGAYDIICESGELGDRHVATVAGPEAFARLFPAGLKALGTLPAGVRAALDRSDDLGAVVALAEAAAPGADAGEPSWGALAHLARETRFVQVFRRLAFMAYAWAVPVADFWAGARPLVADHRYRPYLDTMALPPAEAGRTFGDFLDHFDPTDLEMTGRYLIDALARTDHPRVYGAWGMAMGHGDILARDFSMIVGATPNHQAQYGLNLLRVSPNNAYAMATLVEHDWAHHAGDVPAWRARAGDAPALLRALGLHEAKERRFDEAAKLLARSVESSPDRVSYEALADCYEARGDLDRWKSTLDDYLGKTEDAGLDHARVRVKVADSYMAAGKFAEAKPYAEAAAKTWAGWAMNCAARCAEGLGDLDGAEAWTRRVTERYPNTSWANWFDFCKRTGHGDLAAARAWTDAYLEAVAGRPDLVDAETAAYYHWAAGSPAKARDALARAFDANPTASACIHLAVLADELGDRARRDAALAKLCDELESQAPKSTAICKIFRQALASGGKERIDLEAIAAIVADIPPEKRGNTEFFAGKYLMNHGEPAAGREYLGRCARSDGTAFWFRLIAADALAAPDPPKVL